MKNTFKIFFKIQYFINYIKSLSHNSTLRIIVSYLIVFIVSSLILLSFVYWSSVNFIYKQMDHHIRYDQKSLQLIYKQQGKNKLISTITERLEQQNYESIYLLYNSETQQILAGNLSHIPQLSAYDFTSGIQTFRLSKLSNSIHHKNLYARLIQSNLSHHIILFNGLNTQSIHKQEHVIVSSLVAGIAIILILGAIGGYIVSLNTIKKINSINQAMFRVGEGSLDERIPLRGTDDDFDLLASNFNQMLERLQVSMQQVQNISTNIAHDLRTPLTRVHNRLEMLAASISTATAQDHGIAEGEIEAAIEDTDNLLATFETILNINKFESGAQKLNIQTLSSKKLLDDLINYNEPMATDKFIEINASQLPEHHFSGDQNMLFLALTNLLNNAIKYTPVNGVISVTCQLTQMTMNHKPLVNEFLEIIIADNGAGIAEQDKTKVFELFYRCEKSRSLPGNGLGLPLVSAVISLHKGLIELGDNHPGLQVSVYLPLS